MVLAKSARELDESSGRFSDIPVMETFALGIERVCDTVKPHREPAGCREVYLKLLKAASYKRRSPRTTNPRLSRGQHVDKVSSVAGWAEDASEKVGW